MHGILREHNTNATKNTGLEVPLLHDVNGDKWPRASVFFAIKYFHTEPHNSVMVGIKYLKLKEVYLYRFPL